MLCNLLQSIGYAMALSQLIIRFISDLQTLVSCYFTSFLYLNRLGAASPSLRLRFSSYSEKDPSK